MALLTSTSVSPFPASPREVVPEYPARYRLEDLGELAPGVPLLPVAFGSGGALVVYGHTSERQLKTGCVRTFLRRAGRMSELASDVGGVPIAAMSGHGLLCGQQRGPSGLTQAWASHRGLLGAEWWPQAESTAVGVNNSGEVAGHVTLQTGDRVRRRVFMHDGGEPRLMPTPGGVGATAVAINDSGTVLANCSVGLFETQSQAQLWWGDSVTVIRGAPDGGLWATGLTPGGRVCGRLLTSDGNIRAFLYEGARTYALNEDPQCQSEALAANDRRVVVGRMMDDSGQRTAFRWTPVEGMRSLAELIEPAAGWALHKATAVDAAGLIAGTGWRDGALRGFLLVPVSH